MADVETGFGPFIAKRFSFLFAAALCVPTLWALTRIDGNEIDYARARAAKKDAVQDKARYRDLLKNRQLMVFAASWPCSSSPTLRRYR